MKQKILTFMVCLLAGITAIHAQTESESSIVSFIKTADDWKVLESMYRTKGDANNVEDAYEVRSNYLLGKVVASSLLLGKISRLVANPLIFVPVILVPLFAILLANLLRTIRLAGKIAKDEEQAAVREAIEELRKRQEAGQMPDSPKEQGEEPVSPEVQQGADGGHIVK